MTDEDKKNHQEICPSPPNDFHKLNLRAKQILPSKLYRSGPRNSGEPYFGRTASNRFDSPSKAYGTCYLGLDLHTAIAETLLHDLKPVNGQFQVASEVFASRWIVRFENIDNQKLKLADLTGIGLLRAGGNAALSAVVPYDIPQQWSHQVFTHPANFDGIHYLSRKLNDRPAVVLFDKPQTKAKIGLPIYTALPNVKSIDRIRRDLGIHFDS
jgi:hypothetical protein